MRATALESIGRPLRRGLATALLLLAALALLPAAPASADIDSPQLWDACDSTFAPTGQRCSTPGGVAANPANGRVYLADRINRRLIEFSVWGQFLRTWGWGVVASGPGNDPRNEIQQLTVDATGGNFKLRWSCGLATTASIPFNASAAQLQQALEGLPDTYPCSTSDRPSGASGDFAVAGPVAGPWQIEYTGANADLDLPRPQVVDSTLTGGTGAAVADLQQGASFEVCVPAAGDICRPGQDGASPGQLSPMGVALDSAGDLYVVDISNRRLQKFSSEGELIWMLGGGVNQGGGTPSSPGNLCTAQHLANGDACGAGTQGAASGQFGALAVGSYIAIDRKDIATVADDDVWVGDEGRIQRFDATGVYQGEVSLPGETVQLLALDPAGGGFYAVFSGESSVHKLSAAGAVLNTITIAEQPTALATGPTGNLYVAYAQRSQPLPAQPMTIRKYSPAGAQLGALEQGNAFTGSDSTTGIAVNPVTSAGDIALYVSTIRNAGDFLRAYSPIPDADGFDPPPPVAPEIVDTYSTHAETDAVTVNAQINPHFWADTSYYLEYGTDGPCSTSTNPCAQVGFPGTLLGAGVVASPQTVAVELPGLDPATTYHYRFVAQSSGGGPTFGPDAAFTTFPTDPDPDTDCPNQAFRIGPGALLTECRAYEMVTPVDKNGANVRGPDWPGSERATFQTDPAGAKLTYAARNGFGQVEATPFAVGYLATRDPAAGWSSRGIDPPRGNSGGSIYHQSYFDFSEDLSIGWLFTESDPQPDPAAPAGYWNLYRRDFATDTYTALNTVTPPTTEPIKAAASTGQETEFNAFFAGASEDGSRAFFMANDRLTAPASSATDGDRPIWQLYERADGQPLRVVSRLPGGAASALDSIAGGGTSHLAHAVSADGRRVYWTTGDYAGGASISITGLGTPHSGRVYVSEAGTTLPVSEPASPDPAHFEAAARDGSAALFTVGAQPHSNVGGELYRFDLASGESPQVATGVLGVGGASEDLSRAYFVSTEVLDPAPNSEGDTARPGGHNIYLYQQGEGISFVASRTIFSVEEGPSHSIPWTIYGDVATRQRQAHVSADGRYLLFAARDPLTGFESVGAGAGFPSTQVFRHDAEADQLSCLSCNSTGARLDDSGNAPLQNGSVTSSFHQPGTSALLTGWRNGPFDQQNSLSADGNRVYFDSFDRLLPRDTNGMLDVYEWRAPGTGGCEASDPHYFEANEGCIALISTGRSDFHSEFIEATPDGRTVFFRTSERLLARDSDGLLDIYAARIGGGLVSQHPPPVPPPCEGEACRGAASPAPPQAGAGSAVFEGPPNPPPDRCAPLSGKARALSRQAKALRARAAGLRRAARRSSNPRRSRAMRRGAKRLATAAKKRSRAAREQAGRAKRCRRAAR